MIDDTFEPVTVNGRWTINVPEWLARWDVWPSWEPERLASIAEHLNPGDVLFDVGAEVGWMSALLGQIVGPSSMCLFEGSPLYWPSMLAIWEQNHDLQPRACWPGLVGDKTITPQLLDYDPNPGRGVWPMCAMTGQRVEGDRPYRYIHGHGHSTLQCTLDDWVEWTGNVPRGITIDVEGAELRVLTGAAGILERHRPLVWVSVHPELLERDYEATAKDVHAFMASLDYDNTHLATDHEHHHLYWPL